MRKRFTLLMCILSGVLAVAQTTATFESFELPPDTFLNGSDGGGGFADGNIFLPNDYNEQFDSWSGWAISTTTDNETPGFMNQYSAITGGGYDGSQTYAVTYAPGGSVIRLVGEAAGGVVEGLYLTNGAYAYLSMLNGDAFAKKFGGETGDDPDFFLLTVKKYLDGELSADSVNFYLADYRFENNAQDYIVDEWTYLDLSSLGNADSLLFTLSSSDVGQFGMNTPAYFCIEDVITADRTVAAAEAPAPGPSLHIFPNPAVDFLTLDWEEERPARLALFDARGRIVKQVTVRPGRQQLDLRALSAGMYFLRPLGRRSPWSRGVVRR